MKYGSSYLWKQTLNKWDKIVVCVIWAGERKGFLTLVVIKHRSKYK